MQEVTTVRAVDAIAIPVRSTINAKGSDTVRTPTEVPVTTNPTSWRRIGARALEHGR